MTTTTEVPIANQNTVYAVAAGNNLYVGGSVTLGGGVSFVANGNVAVDGSVFGNDAWQEGIEYENASGNVTVYSGGTVRTFRDSGIYVHGTGSVVVDNFGQISGHFGGVTLNGDIASATLTLNNYGTLSADEVAIIQHTGVGSFVVHNTGTISGALGSFQNDMPSGNDTITNSGHMIGQVLMGGGDDFIDTHLGTVQGKIDLGAGSDTAYGSAAADSILGGSENDVIRGNGGKDILDGGDGTQDYIDFSDKTTKVEITLLAPGVTGSAKVNGLVEDTFKNFEAVVGGSAGDSLTGNFGSNNIAGGKGNDTAVGASGNDSIFGGEGNDLIGGSLGNDQLTGNAGADLFRFNSTLSTSANLDTITDFVHASDEVQLDDAVFTALTSPWSSAQFKAAASGHVANTANQHILYDQSTGVLWYDPDGSGAGGQAAFAKLGNSTHPTIDWTDFAIV
jgi:Ca2+-binding RTX toxin-like protein